MSKAQHDCYLSSQTKNFGEMGQVIIKGNKLKPFKLFDYCWIVFSQKHYTEKMLIERLIKGLEELKSKIQMTNKIENDK